jgi:hypothetical protein
MSQFIDRWREVGGMDAPPVANLKAPEIVDLPRYVPMIQHGYCFDRPLNLPYAMLPTFGVFSTRRNRTYGRLSPDTSVHSEFNLNQSCCVILISVSTDDKLETYWRYRRSRDIPSLLSRQGITAVSVPNFSYFTDAPRWHTIWNRRRMLCVAEEISKANVGIMPHLNALTTLDWEMWRDLLCQQTDLRFVVKEFQTGGAYTGIGERMFQDLCNLQSGLGREIHPILVGGARFWSQLCANFRSFTVVDSTPFMKTVYRREIVISEQGVVQDIEHPMDKNGDLHPLWETNLARYKVALENRLAPQRERPGTPRRHNSAQLQLWDTMSH